MVNKACKVCGKTPGLDSDIRDHARCIQLYLFPGEELPTETLPVLQEISFSPVLSDQPVSATLSTEEDVPDSGALLKIPRP